MKVFLNFSVLLIVIVSFSSCNKQKNNSDKEVLFLFLANRCSEKQWKSTIANHGFTGDHVLLTDEQFEELSGEFGITGIPHYRIIDKGGNVVSKDASRSSSKEILIPELERLL